MDIKSFLDRTNLTKADVLRKLGRDPKSSLLSAYQSGASFPSFDMALNLLKLGMTPKELFGEDIDDILKAYYASSPTVPPSFDTPEFREGVAKALEDLKAKGLIK